MLPFIRPDLAKFSAYKPHPGSDNAEPVQPTQIDRLDTNESPYDLPSELKEKLAWNYQQIIESNRYPDGGHEELKRAIAEYVNESAHLAASSITSEHISVGNGSDELIRSLLIATCLHQGAILVAHPTFSMYAILAQTLGIPVVTVPRNSDNFAIDINAAQSAIESTQNPPIRAVFVVHPNSPTANALTDAEISWLKSLPREILVVIDEAYFEFSQSSLVGEILHHENWTVLRTFSKAFRLAAHRVGYCIAHPELIAILEKVRLPYNLPSFSLAAAIAAMQNRQLLLASISETLTERDKMIAHLSANPSFQVWDSTTNFIFLRPVTGDASSLKQLHQQLKAQGTLVREINQGLRITIGTPAENSRTLERLQAAR
ncbi:histidinol-phosphate transaminase [Calothrix sp. 336/3]|uniref:histidinol-phosphate transaminase n=1 Tax=Calothrix sp. 336/3 TaxID=1337936 RepID=UPI0004E40553|nr:histidinol-phosphate transaminase [Calothrix sp. 336/3]AKG22305.1 histidinol-phosphate aminotransferase [Calothrix sp. 336/3]